MEGNSSPDILNNPDPSPSFPVEDIESLATRVQQSLQETPANVPEYMESNPFWDSVSILNQPGIRYGDVRIVPHATDAHGTRRAFERKMYDVSGQEIGVWNKRGFVTPDNHLASFSENVSSDAKTSDEVEIVFNKDGKVYAVKKTHSENYSPVDVSEIRYSYDQNGKVDGTKQTENRRGVKVSEVSKGYDPDDTLTSTSECVYGPNGEEQEVTKRYYLKGRLVSGRKSIRDPRTGEIRTEPIIPPDRQAPSSVSSSVGSTSSEIPRPPLPKQPTAQISGIRAILKRFIK